VYVPADTLAAVTATAPVAPEIVVGPVAFSVKSVATFVPPWVLEMVLASVNLGLMSVFVMLQVAAWPAAKTKLLPVRVPDEHVQALAV